LLIAMISADHAQRNRAPRMCHGGQSFPPSPAAHGFEAYILSFMQDAVIHRSSIPSSSFPRDFQNYSTRLFLPHVLLLSRVNLTRAGQSSCACERRVLRPERIAFSHSVLRLRSDCLPTHPIRSVYRPIEPTPDNPDTHTINS
jgi:hypothetical protein